MKYYLPSVSCVTFRRAHIHKTFNRYVSSLVQWSNNVMHLVLTHEINYMKTQILMNNKYITVVKFSVLEQLCQKQ